MSFTFNALMWKSIQIRKCYWKTTVIELLLPVALFACLFNVHKYSSNIQSSSAIIANESIIRPIFESVLQMSRNSYIVYTPPVKATHAIMDLVEERLKLNEAIEYTGSEEEMVVMLKEHLDNRRRTEDGTLGFGIVFVNHTNKGDFKYEYTIRPTDSAPTKQLFPTTELPGPMNNQETYTKGFLALQLAVDKALVEISVSDAAKEELKNYRLNVGPYPYKKYVMSTTTFEEYRKIFRSLLELMTFISFLITSLNTIRWVTEEKNSGANEFLKGMGLKPNTIRIGWLLHNVLGMCLPITCITWYCCYAHTMDKLRIFNHTSPPLFWAFLMMYVVAVSFYSLAVSSFFHQPSLAMFFGVVLWCIMFGVTWWIPKVSYALRLSAMLLPTVAMSNGYLIITSMEVQGRGVRMSNLSSTGRGDVEFSFGVVVFMLFFDSIVLGLIAWYVEAIRPGKYGIAKPVNFPCVKSNSVRDSNLPDETATDTSQPNKPTGGKRYKLFEKVPDSWELGMSARSVHKRFGKVEVISGVDLELYKGQITALLGHNGSGKTTTILIMTGQLSPNRGVVEANGTNIHKNLLKFRKNIGVCPQKNLLLPYLNIIDHLVFYGMLKGMPKRDALVKGHEMLEKFQITNNPNEVVRHLSDGIKRKLSVAIALIGDPEIIILDEPTTGMDPESRRLIWDMLLVIRTTKTILITTHFMEEAEVLGDRISIIDNGRIKCCGSAIFLKNAYGTGYYLTVLKRKTCDINDKIIEEVKRIEPEAELISSFGSKMVFNLPKESAKNFTVLLRTLEQKKEEYCIIGMGVSSTTMEDVYLSSYSKRKSIDGESSISTNESAEQMPGRKPLDKWRVCLNQFLVMMIKKMLHTKRRWLLLLCFGSLTVILCVISVMMSYIILGTKPPHPLKMELKNYKESLVHFRRLGNTTEHNLMSRFLAISKEHQAKELDILTQTNLISDLLIINQKNEFKYRSNLLLAGKFDDYNTTIFYNTIGYHTSPIAINMYSNALLQKLTGVEDAWISTTNEPINFHKAFCDYDSISLKLTISPVYILLFASSFLFLSSQFVSLPLSERLCGIKQLQLMTKLSPTVYWLTCFIWDYFCYLIIVVITLTAVYQCDRYGILSNPKEIAVFKTLLLVYGFSSIFYVYLYSYFGKSLVSSIALFITINFALGLIVNMLVLMFKATLSDHWKTIRLIVLLIPNFSFSLCIAEFVTIAWLKYKCMICQDPFFLRYSCDSVGVRRIEYFEYANEGNPNGLLEEFYCMIAGGVISMFIIMLAEYKVFSEIYAIFENLSVGKGGQKGSIKDSEVQLEKNRVKAAMKKDSEESWESPPPPLIVSNLTKKYSISFTAIRGVSFIVDNGECFGLLGTNGAGKSITFRILTGDTFPSNGDAVIHVNGKKYNLTSFYSNYLNMIGYCPQSEAINNWLTGKETLTMMALLRGLHFRDAKAETDLWIRRLDLEEYSDRLVETYSNGNKRKLNVAMALIGDPPVVFLDEPTSGVDPATKRNLWRILAEKRKSGQAFVLTSHSMDECEALCDRLTIMVNGVMKCIGDVQYLKNKFGQGYTVMIKLTEITDLKLSELETKMLAQYSPEIILKDKSVGLLHYHISDNTVKLSEIFGFMDSVKKNFVGVEDYTISDTSLEQVFMSIAKGKAVASRDR